MWNIWRTIALTSGAQVYTLITGVVVLALTARWLGPAGRGAIAATLTWVTLFSTLGFLSLGQVAIHRATTMRDRQWLGGTLGSLFTIAVAITLVSWIAVAIIFATRGASVFGDLPARYLAIGFVALPWFVWEQYGSALLFALGKVA